MKDIGFLSHSYATDCWGRALNRTAWAEQQWFSRAKAMRFRQGSPAAIGHVDDAIEIVAFVVIHSDAARQEAAAKETRIDAGPRANEQAANAGRAQAFEIRKIEIADVLDRIAKGVHDFGRAPAMASRTLIQPKARIPLQANANKRCRTLVGLLPFISFYFPDSGLFNGLRPSEIRKFARFPISRSSCNFRTLSNSRSARPAANQARDRFRQWEHRYSKFLNLSRLFSAKGISFCRRPFAARPCAIAPRTHLGHKRA